MSLDEPHPAETFVDLQFEEFVQNLCLRPGMYVYPASFGTVCAFLDGFNEGRGSGPLLGFREWLVVRNNGQDNVMWQGIVARELGIPTNEFTNETDTESIRSLGRLLANYFQIRKENGITKIYYDYGNWLLRKDWYEGPLRKKASEGK
jgi:hypothetical protein